MQNMTSTHISNHFPFEFFPTLDSKPINEPLRPGLEVRNVGTANQCARDAQSGPDLFGMIYIGW